MLFLKEEKRCFLDYHIHSYSSPWGFWITIVYDNSIFVLGFWRSFLMEREKPSIVAEVEIVSGFIVDGKVSKSV